jgi:hypothetical protein
MPRFRVTYIIDASNSYNAHRALTPCPIARKNDPNIRMVQSDVTKVRGPLGKRKKWNIHRNGVLYARANTTKKNAEAIAAGCRANCSIVYFVFTVVEA